MRNSNGKPIATPKKRIINSSAIRMERSRNLRRVMAMEAAGMLIRLSAGMNAKPLRVEAQTNPGADGVALLLGRRQNEKRARRAHVIFEAIAQIIHLLDERGELMV